MTQRQQQVSREIVRLAADFLAHESNRRSLVTVTRAHISPDLADATIYLSVLPHSMEAAVLSFVKRKRTDLRNHLKTHGKFKRLPHVDFEIDDGEKHRQRLDALL